MCSRHEHRFGIEISLRHLGQRPFSGGTTEEMMMPSSAFGSSPAKRSRLDEQDAPLIGRLLADRAQTAMVHQLAVLENADRDVGVAGVERE